MSSSDLENIRNFIIQSRLNYSHYTLAQFVHDSYQNVSEFCLWLCVLVQHELEQGHVCVSVDAIAEKSKVLGWRRIPQKQELLNAIHNCSVTGKADELTPLILDQNKLYLNRLYHNEKTISDFLLARTQQGLNIPEVVKVHISNLFIKTAELDHQHLALINCLRHPLSIISGGPGTGKTWVVGKILEVLLQQQTQQHQELKIRLAAPTGKAAARLTASIKLLLSNMILDQSMKHLMPEQAVTLHRLLGLHRFTHRARYHQKNPLDCDVLVIDEASMIDQQMMSTVCKALPPKCKLILLGDKDQLSSVEAGSVFADLCGGVNKTRFTPQQCDWLKQQFDLDFEIESTGSSFALSDHVLVLQKSRRFDDQSSIGKLAKCINQGDAEHALSLLNRSKQESGLIFQQVASHELLNQLKQQTYLTYSDMMQADSVEKAFAQFHQYQILCAVWSGPNGVDHINRTIDTWLKSQQEVTLQEEYYKGKPLIMTANLHQYEIYNGDIGIVWPDEQGQLSVWFEQPGEVSRSLSLSQCPSHKTAYAMTVHKSQGSEFNHVLMVLPETVTPVSTRELLYTGITRAIDSVEIWATENIIEASIQQKTERESGLMQRLFLKPIQQ